MNLNGRKLGAGCSPCTETATRPTNSCDPRKVISITRAGDKIIVALNDCTFLTADKDALDPSITGGNSGKCECGKEIAELEKKITDLEKKIPTEHKEPKELGELVPVYNAKGELSYYAHAAPAEPGDPVPPPDLPSPPEGKPTNEKSKVEIEFFVDGASTYKIELEGKPGTKIPREQFDAKMKEYMGQNKELMTTTFAEDAVFQDINYTQYYFARLRTPKMSKVIFKRVDLPPEGWNLDSHATILGELTGKVGSEIPTTIYDEHAKSSRYLKFVSSDFTPPMYFPDSETPTVFTITMQRLPIQAEDGAATARFKFIEQDTNKTLKEFAVDGTIGFKIPATKYDEALTELQNQGYYLVSTTFNSSKVFQGITDEDTFETIMREHVVPFDPNNPPSPSVDETSTATFRFIMKNTNEILKEVTVKGNVGLNIPRTEYDSVLKELQNKGYKLVSTTFNPPESFEVSPSLFRTIVEEFVPSDPNIPNPPNPDPLPSVPSTPPAQPNDPMEPSV